MTTAPINLGLALFLSCIFPGLGLWRVDYGKLVIFLGYVPAVFLIFFLGLFTLGFGWVALPLIWGSGLFVTWFYVRLHNRQAAKDAGIAQQFAELQDQVQNLSG